MPIAQLRILIGNLVFSKSHEPSERQDIANPFNLLLDHYLRHYKEADAPLSMRSRQRFPGLSYPEAQQQWRMLLVQTLAGTYK